jgi:hypothetical protein
MKLLTDFFIHKGLVPDLYQAELYTSAAFVFAISSPEMHSLSFLG